MDFGLGRRGAEQARTERFCGFRTDKKSVFGPGGGVPGRGSEGEGVGVGVNRSGGSGSPWKGILLEG